MKFSDFFMNEAAQFAKGQDQDFIGDQEECVIFSSADISNYKVQGKTHGIMSHALKHMVEFKHDFVIKVLDSVKSEIRSYLKSHPDQYCRVLFKNKSVSKEEGLKVLDVAHIAAYINTLDVINDKITTGTKLLDIERILKKYAVQIQEEYSRLIDARIGNSFSLDSIKNGTIEDYVKAIKSHEIINFDSTGRAGQAGTVFLDFRDLSILIKTVDYVRTLYRVDGVSSRSSLCKYAIKAGFKAEIPAITGALRSI